MCSKVDQWGGGNFYFFFQGRDRFDRTSLSDQNRFPTSGRSGLSWRFGNKFLRFGRAKAIIKLDSNGSA